MGGEEACEGRRGVSGVGGIWSVGGGSRWKGMVEVVDGDFFFQAEDGIRDRLVTGVQTCALPIFPSVSSTSLFCLRAEGYVTGLLIDSSQIARETERDRKSVV